MSGQNAKHSDFWIFFLPFRPHQRLLSRGQENAPGNDGLDCVDIGPNLKGEHQSMPDKDRQLRNSPFYKSTPVKEKIDGISKPNHCLLICLNEKKGYFANASKKFTTSLAFRAMIGSQAGSGPSSRAGVG